VLGRDTVVAKIACNFLVQIGGQKEEKTKEVCPLGRSNGRKAKF